MPLGAAVCIANSCYVHEGLLTGLTLVEKQQHYPQRYHVTRI